MITCRPFSAFVALGVMCGGALAQLSEVDSLLTTSHTASWGYFQDVARTKWYITNDAGTCYALGTNSRVHSSWIALANEQSICGMVHGLQTVTVNPNAGQITPSEKYKAISLVGGEGAETMFGPLANQWATKASGAAVLIDWYFFKVESTQKWYIVKAGPGNSAIYRLKLNANLSDYDWQKPVNAQGVAVDTSGWIKEYASEGGAWKVKFNSGDSVTTNTGFLSFPISTSLYPQGAYTPSKIISVVDHHMSAVYSDLDGYILSFTGELFQSTTQRPPAKQQCYPKAGGGSWSTLLRNLYTGTSSDGCTANAAINYEAHPGYDYFAVAGTSVYAAATGRVVSSNGGCVPKGLTAGCAAWGAIGIDHGNGYISQYLHLGSVMVSAGDQVANGQLIGLSGNKSPPGTLLGAHLHFEVLRLRTGLANNYDKDNYATVDPYGFDTSKGYSDYITTYNGNLPNVCLWKQGCTYQ